MNDDRIYEVLGKISEDVSELKVTSAKQEENIKEHMRRTELAEENLSLLRKEMEPLKLHVVSINAMLKGIGLVSVVVGSIVGIIQAAEIFIKIFK